MLETRFRTLGQEYPLAKEMATHSSTLAWKIPWMEKPRRLQSVGRKEVDMTEWLHFHLGRDRKSLVAQGVKNLPQSPWGWKESDTTERLTLSSWQG